MGTVLFWVIILATIGQLVVPLQSKTRSAAIYGWLTMLVASMGAAMVRDYTVHDWQEPSWSHSLVAVILSWLFLVGGAVIAARKPKSDARTN